MGKNFMQRQQEECKRWAMAGRINEQAFCCDIMMISLGRLGYGEKRLKEFEKVFSETYIEYDDLRTEDGKDDKDNWYFKDTIDKEIKQYVGSLFEPYDKRHYLSR